MKSLTPEQVALVKTTLDHAREGKATLCQLAAAHDLANGANLNGTLGELREHMRRMVPAPPMKMEAKAVVLGIVSGVLTHYLLNGVPTGEDKHHV
jgi:hypothetical protein